MNPEPSYCCEHLTVDYDTDTPRCLMCGIPLVVMPTTPAPSIPLSWDRLIVWGVVVIGAAMYWWLL